MKETIAKLKKENEALKDDLTKLIINENNTSKNIYDAQRLVEVYRELILRQQKTINDLVEQTKGFELSWGRPFQADLALSGFYYDIQDELSHKCEVEDEDQRNRNIKVRT